jgi:hypothetical protein
MILLVDFSLPRCVVVLDVFVFVGSKALAWRSAIVVNNVTNKKRTLGNYNKEMKW